MEDLNNQLTVERVENGWIVTVQVKKETSNLFAGIFGGHNTMSDKTHHVATTKEQLAELLQKQTGTLKSPSEIRKLLAEEEKILEIEENSEDEEDVNIE